jgi:hypothetical protein
MSTGSICEAALLALVRAYDSGSVFHEANSAIGDYRVLDAATGRAGAVIARRAASLVGTNLSGRGSHGNREEDHRLQVLVGWRRQQAPGGDGPLYVALAALTDALVGHLARYARLGLGASSVVQRAQVVSVGEVRVNRAGSHLLQVIEIDALCRVAADYVEVPG